MITLSLLDSQHRLTTIEGLSREEIFEKAARVFAATAKDGERAQLVGPPYGTCSGMHLVTRIGQSIVVTFGSLSPRVFAVRP